MRGYEDAALGLRCLLEEPLSDACAQAAATAASAAVAIPSIVHIIAPVVFADAVVAPSGFSLGLKGRQANSDIESSPHELKSIISVFHPKAVLTVLAKNVGISCLLRFNVYMLSLLDHENNAQEAEAQGLAAPPGPPFPDMSVAVVGGAKTAGREMAIRFVRRVYEHIAVWRLGSIRAAPFLRDGVAWVSNVLFPMYKNEVWSTRAFKYGFAMLHANALLYAADCTVWTVLHVYAGRKELRQKKVHQAALAVGRIASYQVVRCSAVLITTSVTSALLSLAKPGLGTKIGWVGFDHVTNMAVANVAKALSS